MPKPGEWGFYASYTRVVRVEESQSKTTSSHSSSRGESTFTGVVFNLLNGNNSVELIEKNPNHSFWERESGTDKNHNQFVFGKSEVAYEVWKAGQERLRSQALISKTSKKGNAKMGNITTNTMDKVMENLETQDNDDDDMAIVEANFPNFKGKLN